MQSTLFRLPFVLLIFIDIFSIGVRFFKLNQSIDVMSSFRIGHSCGIYEFILDKESITKYADYHGTIVPFTSLEDWLIAYQLMIDREVKVNLIKRYLEANGVLNPHLLNRTLDQILPIDTRNMIINFLD